MQEEEVSFYESSVEYIEEEQWRIYSRYDHQELVWTIGLNDGRSILITEYELEFIDYNDLEAIQIGDKISYFIDSESQGEQEVNEDDMIILR